MNQIDYDKKYLESKYGKTESTFEALFSMFLTLVLFGTIAMLIIAMS